MSGVSKTVFAESYKIEIQISNKSFLFKTRTCSMNTGPVRCHLHIEYAQVQYGFGTIIECLCFVFGCCDQHFSIEWPTLLL